MTYRRSVRLPHGPGVLALVLSGRRPGWRLERGDPRDAGEASLLCGALLDTEADPDAIDGALAADPLLRELVAAAPGRRVPGCVDPAELAVRAVLGQQITIENMGGAGGTLANARAARSEAPRSFRRNELALRHSMI